MINEHAESTKFTGKPKAYRNYSHHCSACPGTTLEMRFLSVAHVSHRGRPSLIPSGVLSLEYCVSSLFPPSAGDVASEAMTVVDGELCSFGDKVPHETPLQLVVKLRPERRLCNYDASLSPTLRAGSFVADKLSAQ